MKCLVCPRKGRFRFPENSTRRRQWASILRCKELLETRKDPRLCEQHFDTEDCIINLSGKLIMRPGSMPNDDIDNRSDHDITWISSGKTKHGAHQSVLAAISFLMEDILIDTQFVGVEELCIITPDYDEEDITSFLQLLYCGQTVITQKSSIMDIIQDLVVYDNIRNELEVTVSDDEIDEEEHFDPENKEIANSDTDTASDDDVPAVSTVFSLDNETIPPAPVVQNCVDGPDLGIPDVVDTAAGQGPDSDQGPPLHHGEHVSVVHGPVEQHQAGLVAGDIDRTNVSISIENAISGPSQSYHWPQCPSKFELKDILDACGIDQEYVDIISD